MLHISDQPQEWDEKTQLIMKFGKIPEEIPLDICENKHITFPIIAMDVTKVCSADGGTKKCCLICSLEKKENVVSRDCTDKKNHYPYISLTSAKTTNNKESTGNELETTSPSNEKEAPPKKRNKKQYIFMLPMERKENGFVFRIMDSYYWFFLACILSTIKLPNQLILFERQGDDYFPMDPAEKSILLKNLTQYLKPHSIYTLGQRKKSVYLFQSFPLLGQLKEKLSLKVKTTLT